jgi:transaldolase
MTPAEMQAFMHRAGHGDIFPKFDAADRAAIRADGKIPSLARWRPRLESGEVGIDALINAAGLESFSVDQKALDDRVRGLIG